MRSTQIAQKVKIAANPRLGNLKSEIKKITANLGFINSNEYT